MNPEQLGMILLAMATTARSLVDTAYERSKEEVEVNKHIAIALMSEARIMYGIATTLRAGVDECIKMGNEPTV